jgi:hypothetical protein
VCIYANDLTILLNKNKSHGVGAPFKATGAGWRCHLIGPHGIHSLAISTASVPPHVLLYSCVPHHLYKCHLLELPRQCTTYQLYCTVMPLYLPCQCMSFHMAPFQWCHVDYTTFTSSVRMTCGTFFLVHMGA